MRLQHGRGMQFDYSKLANNFPSVRLQEKSFFKITQQWFSSYQAHLYEKWSWLKSIRHLNSLYRKATRVIINHAPIGKYHLRFFLRKNFSCPCSLYLIESRQHIILWMRRYNKYWNSNRKSFSHFIAFLDFNPRAFFFHEEIT